MSEDRRIELPPLTETPGVHNDFALGCEVIVHQEYVQLVFWSDPCTPASPEEPDMLLERAIVRKMVMTPRAFLLMREHLQQVKLSRGMQ